MVSPKKHVQILDKTHLLQFVTWWYCKIIKLWKTKNGLVI